MMARQLIAALHRPLSLLLLVWVSQLGVRQEVTKAQDLAAEHLSRVTSVTLSQSKKSSSSRAICPAQLGKAISGITNRPQFRRSRWGILIQTLSSPRYSSSTLYAIDAQRYFLPASNVKLLTTAAALHQLGPQFRIRTSVYGVGPSSRLTTLRVQGRGDPGLTDAQLSVLAQQLGQQGLRQVDQLIGDDNYFDGPAINPTWEVEDIQATYGAPINNLILNQNAVELKLRPQAIGQPLRVEWANPAEAKNWRIKNSAIAVEATESGSVAINRELGQPVIQITGQLPINSEPESVAVAVPDPAQHFLQSFQRALVAQYISVSQIQVASSFRMAGERELAAIDSLPLAQLLFQTNQESNNLYAESLLRSLGVVAGKSREVNQPETATYSMAERGLAAVKTTLTGLGVDPESYVIVDGSGLSRHNLVSPEALVQTLKAMAKSSGAGIYRASLPVAGVSGTLQNRFQNTPAQGVLQAKTGTLNGVSALSGYLNSPNFQPLVFSILVNQSDQSGSSLRQAIDEIVLLLTHLRSC